MVEIMEPEEVLQNQELRTKDRYLNFGLPATQTGALGFCNVRNIVAFCWVGLTASDPSPFSSSQQPPLLI